jgi:hypothetical protein
LDYPDYEELRNDWDRLEKEHGELKFHRKEYIRDYDTIQADFLIENIDLAFQVWNKKSWAQHLTFDEFCLYVLPYRSTNEPLGQWRKYFMEEYKWLQDSMQDVTDPVEAAVLINEDIKSWFSFDPRFYEHPADQGYDEMIEGKCGRCEDMTNLAIFAMRANGIAVTSDYTPYWANTGNNHAWNSILDKEGNVSIFMGAEANPGEYTLSNKFAKVYRKTFARQEVSLSDAAEMPSDSLPGYINRAYFLDVTSEYGPVNDVRLKLSDVEGQKVAYICVFNTGEWKAIHWSKINNGEVVFTNMGRDIIYLPAIWENSKIVSVGNPFILDKLGNVITVEGTDSIVDLIVGETTYRTTFATTDNIRLDKLRDGVEYELYKWTNDWEKIGSQVYHGTDLKFKEMNSNALYWLKEKDGREEERIFILNDKGEIKFW